MEEADFFTVTRPHGPCAAGLSDEEKDGDPQRLVENREGENQREGKGRFDTDEHGALMKTGAEGKSNASQDGKQITEKARPTAEEGKLEGEKEAAKCLADEKIAVLLTLKGEKCTRHTGVADELNGRQHGFE